MLNNNDILFNLYTSYFSGIFRFTLYSTLVIFCSHFLWKRMSFVSKVNKLPCYKLRFYHILGHAHYVSNVGRSKTHLSKHAYNFMLMEACSVVFRSESVFSIWAGPWPIIHIQRADAVEEILNSSTELKKSWIYKFLYPWLGDGLLNSHGAKWRNRRKLLTPAFHFSILNNILPVINKQAKIFVNILNKHTSDEFIDIVPFVTRCSLDIICESILGAEIRTQTDPSNSYAESVLFLKDVVAERGYNPLIWFDFLFKLSPFGRNFTKHVAIVHEFTNKLIHERKLKLMADSKAMPVNEKEKDDDSHKRKAFLDLLLEEHIKNNSISEEDIREEVDTFTFEGHDTTASSMSWSMYLIGLHAGIQDKIHKELDSIFGKDDRDATMDDLRRMKYLECVIKESLRLYPPVFVFGRDIHQDIKIGDHVIPKGCSVFIESYHLHRDPEVFPNPEKFDPERFSFEQSVGRNNFAYIPFSAGPRNCIGQRFALMEEKTIMSSVLRKFHIRSLDPRDKIHPMAGMILMPAESLRLEVRPRDFKPEKQPSYFYYP